LPDAKGQDRPLAAHGGFAFLFHGVEERDTEDRDRYFEIVAAPDVSSAELVGCQRAPSLPFNLTTSSDGFERKLLSKLFALAREARWSLVRHLLSEYPTLAAARDAAGTTLLHVCSEQAPGAELLSLLKEHGASHEAKDANGRRPDEMGRPSFRELVRQVWGLSPDLFEDPEGWFKFWDSAGAGVLEAEKFGDALACSYRCNDIGTRWVKSYVNIHHPSGVAKVDLLGDRGLLGAMQTSDEFACLRQQRTLPLFHGGLAKVTAAEHVTLLQMEDSLEQMRTRNGWEIGKPAPRTAQPLPLPAPAAEGSADPSARIQSARAILGFTFEQTRALPGRSWQSGFRIDFAGQEGLDDGGLTKAWVSEIACALWGDAELFDVLGVGCFFKSDKTDTLTLDGVPVLAGDLYRWTGRFVAYALYQRCIMDCRLCAWTFRSLHRAAAPQNTSQPRPGAAEWGDIRNAPLRSSELEWPDTAEGEDAMLGDLASLDHVFASNLWRVRHEMSEEELRWLDFTCGGDELEPGGADMQVTAENRARYVRKCCTALLRQRCHAALQAFTEGFFEVVPARMLEHIPEEGVLRLLRGNEEVSDAQLGELERVVVPAGLVPTRLRQHPRVREAAAWFFRVAQEGSRVSPYSLMVVSCT